MKCYLHLTMLQFIIQWCLKSGYHETTLQQVTFMNTSWT